MSLTSVRLSQLEFFSGPKSDPLKSDFEKILRTIPSQELDYASHNMHPYPAKFIPYYPALFLKHLSSKGDIVVDPMCGAGTTLIEACLAERFAHGIEIDPIAHLISSVAVTPPREKLLTESEKTLFARLAREFNSKRYSEIELPSENDYPNHKLWFREEILQQLLLIRDTIFEEVRSKNYRNFALLCLSSIVRDVSNADPRDIFPQRDANLKVRPKKEVLLGFHKSFAQNKRRILDFSRRVPYSKRGRLALGDARNMPYANEFANLVFTSPPYAYAIDYARVHQLSTLLFVMNNQELREHRKKYIGTDRISLTDTEPVCFEGFSFAKAAILDVFKKDKKCGIILYHYFKDMSVVTKECFRILKPGGHLVYVIGNSTIKKTPFHTDAMLRHISIESGFSIQAEFERPYYVYRMARNRNKQSNTIKKDIFIVAKK